MRIVARSLIILLLLGTWTVAAAGGRPIDQTLEATSDGTVGIELISGSVRFVGWSRNEVRIEGTLEDDVEGLEIDSGKNYISIEVDLVDRAGGMHRADADLVIHVPDGSRIDAESVSADLEVEAIRGSVSIESVNGVVLVKGDVVEADVSTVSSDIQVESGTELTDGSFQTVSGRIEFDGALDPSGRFDFEAVSGHITLRLPPSTSASFNVETFSGKIENELGPPARKSGPYVPSQSLEFSMGDGAARVSIESFSGTVRILSQ